MSRKKTFIRKISKHHFDIQKEKLICSQSSDVFFSCSVPNTNIKFGRYVFKYVYSARKDYLNYLANAKKDSKSFIKSNSMGQTIFQKYLDFNYSILPV